MKQTVRELFAKLSSPFGMAEKLDQLHAANQQQSVALARQIELFERIIELQAQQQRSIDGLREQTAQLFPQRGQLGWDDPRSSISLFKSLCERAQIDTLDLIQAEMPAAVCELDHRLFLVNALSHAKLDGVILEFGVFTGTTLRWMAESAPTRHFLGFDSFSGLPEAWSGYMTFDFDLNAQPPSLPANVSLITGQFQDTLPSFVTGNRPVSMVHVDCDLYESARVVLEHLAASLRPGTVLVFDEYFNYPGFRGHEYRACKEFLARTGRRIEWLLYSGERVAGVLH